ncbi:hypothetical protein [Prauserella marina]|uniref:hypothetical protein n=1 Tax=Prauserella marina TaxID=530584 RepID=UPI0030B8250C
METAPQPAVALSSFTRFATCVVSEPSPLDDFGGEVGSLGVVLLVSGLSGELDAGGCSSEADDVSRSEVSGGFSSVVGSGSSVVVEDSVVSVDGVAEPGSARWSELLYWLSGPGIAVAGALRGAWSHSR